MQWWCSAQGIPWTWVWRPYLGVWLLVAGVAIAYHRTYRAARPAAGDERNGWRIAAAAGGVVALWLLLDWPVGSLGAGYLASVHMVQFLGLAMAVPTLLLWGLPAGWEDRRGPRTRAILARLARPLTAVIGFNFIVYLTHLPAVVDGLMVTQAGSFALDLAWLIAGLAFWWPVVRRWPRPGLSAPGRLAYLIGGLGAHMGVGMVLAVVPFPLYRVFELAPPFGGMDALGDQQRAGGLMLFGDVLVGLIAVAILVHVWRRAER